MTLVGARQTRRYLPLLSLMVITAIGLAACGGNEDPTSTPQPTATSQSATQTTAAVATATSSLPAGTYSGEVVMPVRAIGSLSGMVSRARGGQPPGVGEYLFVMGDDGDAMSPYLATGWEVSSDLEKATVKLRKGIKILITLLAVRMLLKASLLPELP